MLKKFIEEKFNEITLKIPSDIKEFPFFKVINDILDYPFIQNFLKAELDWWLYEDRVFRSLNHSFNFSKIENSNIIDKIDDIYRENAIITKDELFDLIKKAIILHTNYLILPTKTLVSFVFTNTPHISRGELLLKLNFFSGYDFLIDMIKAKINKESITRVEFEKIIKSVLNEYFTNSTENEFVNLIDDFNNYFGYDYKNVPIKIIDLLFPQLGLDYLSEKIKAQLANDVQTIEINELLKIIADNISGNEEISEDAPKIKEEIEETIALNKNGNIDYTEKIDASLDKLMAFYDDLTLTSENDNKAYSSTNSEVVTESVISEPKENDKKIDDIMNKIGTDELSADDIDALFSQ